MSSTHSHDLDERACWAALAVVSLIAGLCWWTTALLLPLSVAIACVLAPRRGPEDVSLRSAAVLLAGLLLFAGFCLPIAQRAEPFVLEAGLQAMVYAAMGVWIAWGAGALAAAWTRRRMSGQAVPGWRYGEPPRASTHGVDLLECGRKRPRNWHAPPAQ